MINLNISRRDFLKVLGGGALLASSQACALVNRETLDNKLVNYEGPYIQNGELRDEYALMIALNLSSKNNQTRYNQSEYDGRVISNSKQAILIPLLTRENIQDSEGNPHALKNLTRFLSTVGFESPKDLVLPRDVTDPTRIEYIVNQLNPLGVNETFEQRITSLTKHNRYFQLHEGASKHGNVLAQSILHRDRRIILEAALFGARHEIDSSMHDEWYPRLNRWRHDFTIGTIGAKLLDISDLGKQVSPDLSMGYVKIKSKLGYIGRDTWNTEIKVPLDYFYEMIQGTKYDGRSYKKAIGELEKDFNLKIIDSGHVEFRDRLYVYLMRRVLSTGVTGERSEDWKQRVLATALRSDAYPIDVKITIHERS